MLKNIYFKLIISFLIAEFLGIFLLHIYNYSIFKESVSKFELSFTKSYNQLQNTFLKNSIQEAKKNLEIIVNTNSFSDKSFENRLKIQQLFYDITSTRNDILQMRYIDNSGKEIIKVQKYDEDITAVALGTDLLQNKRLREYFHDTLTLNKDEYYISNFDLNIEFHKIEIPFKPTLRVITPIIQNNKRLGILAININMNRYLEIFNKLENFDIYLIDKNGSYILNPDSNKNWSNVLNLPYNIKMDFESNIVNGILNSKEFNKNFLYSYSLDDLFQNNQGIKVIYKIKDNYLEEGINSFNLRILKIMIIFNLIIGVLYFIFYSKINKKLEKEIIKNDANVNIINRYVPTSITDEKGVIVYVNEAFCKLTGYSKKELIGEKHSVLKSGLKSKEFYDNLWKTLRLGQVWEGEMENIKKNGQRYWVEVVIYPKYNEQSHQMEYMGISHNVTDKKMAEKIANTDHLTNLYNRKKIDDELEKAIYSVSRYNLDYTLMIIDIDFFKKVNDEFGHNIGDYVLVEIANLLKEKTRKTDIVGRWGGEEFIVITPNTTLQNAVLLAKNINKAVEEHIFKYVGKKTISVGVTTINDEDNIVSCIERADKNLYEAKESGRNKVIF